MKQRLLLLLIALAGILPLRVVARDFTYTYEGQTITYTVIDETARTCMIVGGFGQFPISVQVKNLILPSHPYDGDKEFSLVELGSNAFSYSDICISVTIPETVTWISGPPFLNFVSLESICIGGFLNPKCIPMLCQRTLKEFRVLDEDGYYNVEDGVLFNNSKTTIIAVPNGKTGSYKIPDTVEKIEYPGFSGSELSSIYIPNSVNEICANSFSSVGKLTTVKIPKSVKILGDKAFGNCHKLTEVLFEGPIPTLGSGVFSFCENLKTISFDDDSYVLKEGALFNKSCTRLIMGFAGSIGDHYKIPDTVTEIAGGAFAGLQELYSIEIPSSVSYIGENAFESTNLISVKIPNLVKVLESGVFSNCRLLTSVDLPNSITSINDYAFQFCATLTELKIPESVTYIGKSAFYECSKLININLPESLASLNQAVFYGCQNLASIIIPESVTSIDWGAFIQCTNLRTVVIPKNVTSIGDVAFWGCTSLTSLTIGENVSFIGEKAFFYCTDLLTVIFKGSSHDIKKGAFEYCENIEKVFVPSIASWLGVSFADEFSNPLCYGAELIIDNKSTDVVEIPEETQEISDYAFVGLKSLTHVAIPEGVQKIGSSSFMSTGLENVNIPQTVKEIGEKAFQDCKSLLSAVIGKIAGKLTRASEVPESDFSTIGSEAFAGCENLDKVSIGSNVGSVGELAFAGCGSITRIDCYSPLAPDAADNAFDAPIYSQAELHVPAGYADVFESAPVWSSFSKIVADLDVPEIYAEGIELDVIVKTIKEEETVQLTATVTPADATDKSVTWSSSDETVATVDQTGLVKALKAGTATITAETANGLKATCVVTVETKTGVDGVEADAQISAVVREGAIIVTAPEGMEVEVYSMTGMRVAKTREHRVDGLSKGVYIVSVGGKAFKVIV